MPMTKLAHALGNNVDVGIGSVLGALSSLSIASGVAPEPYEGAPQWVGYLISLAVAMAPMAIKALSRWYRGEAAGDRVRAAKKRARADKARAAGKTAEADNLDAEADELDAEAAEKEAKARAGE